MRTGACIFDLDGVLVDTAKYHFKAWKRLTDKLGIDFTENDNERLKGVSRMASLEIILEIGNVKLDERKKLEYATLKNNWYIEYISKMTPSEILPGCVQFITELKNAKIRIAIGSASKNTPMILERVGIQGMFDAVADGNNITKAKPDPEVFLKGAAELGVDPNDCLVFEDAQAGIDAARNGGMHIIGIGQPENLTNAEFVIPGFETMNMDQLRSWYI